MSTINHDWLVLLRVRFPHTVDAMEQSFEAPALSEVWRFGPENCSLNDIGLPNYRSNSWGGFALYSDRETAEASMSVPGDSFPFLSETVEAWFGLALPIKHRGDANFRGHVESGSAIRTAGDDPGGPLAVVTTAGWASREPDQIPRIVDFVSRINPVMDFYSSLEGNVRNSTFYASYDGLDAPTLSLWRSDAAMQGAAYGPGYHNDQIKRHREVPMFDRSSFTRLRVIQSAGTWNGSNPIDEMN